MAPNSKGDKCKLRKDKTVYKHKKKGVTDLSSEFLANGKGI